MSCGNGDDLGEVDVTFGGDFPGGEEPTPGQRRVKYYVKDVEVKISGERIQYLDESGKLITETLKDYTKKAVTKEFKSLDSFLTRWNEEDKKQAIVEELENNGLLLEALVEEVGKDFDPFDLICHVAFGAPPLTRKERATNVRKNNYFSKYEGVAREVLDALLTKYADEGLENIESFNVLKIPPFNSFGTPVEIVSAFGGKEAYISALNDLKNELYNAA